MVLYRRDRVMGGTYFITMTLADRQSTVLTDHIHQLKYSFRQAQKNNYFDVEAIVILPDHLHLLLRLPSNDSDFSTRIRQIKSYFVYELSANKQIVKNRNGEYHLWQRRFWEHRIRNEVDFEAHANYIHYNPVKHGLVKKVIDWPYSSFHRYVLNGILPANWGGASVEIDCSE